MDRPEVDLADRKEVWDSMQMLYMDTDVSREIDSIAKVCAKSKYSIDELETILFVEVFPACRFNLVMLPAPEWSGFEINWLVDRVIQKHRHGKRRLLFLRYYTYSWWKKLKPKIEDVRLGS